MTRYTPLTLTCNFYLRGLTNHLKCIMCLKSCLFDTFFLIFCLQWAPFSKYCKKCYLCQTKTDFSHCFCKWLQCKYYCIINQYSYEESRKSVMEKINALIYGNSRPVLWNACYLPVGSEWLTKNYGKRQKRLWTNKSCKKHTL